MTRDCGVECSLFVFLRFSFLRPGLQALYRQLWWSLGFHWQKFVLAGERLGKLELDAQGVVSFLGSANRMDRYISGYMSSGRVWAQGGRHFGFAADKSSVAGLGSGAQVTLFSQSGKEEVLVAAPQASGHNYLVRVLVCEGALRHSRNSLRMVYVLGHWIVLCDGFPGFFATQYIARFAIHSMRGVLRG